MNAQAPRNPVLSGKRTPLLIKRHHSGTLDKNLTSQAFKKRYSISSHTPSQSMSELRSRSALVKPSHSDFKSVRLFKGDNSNKLDARRNADKSQLTANNFYLTSLTDFCRKPKITRFSSRLSVEAQYALMKTYEDMIHAELSVYYPNLVRNTASTKKIVPVKSKHGKNHTIVAKKPVEPDNEASSTTNLKFYQGDKPKKLRYTHYIETAHIILDSIEIYKKNVRSAKNTHSIKWLEDQENIYDLDKNLKVIANMYGRWAYLWNKEFDQILLQNECEGEPVSS